MLRSVSKTIGLDGEEIVPNEDQINKMQQAQEQAPPPPQPGQEEQVKAGVPGAGAPAKPPPTPAGPQRRGAIPSAAAQAQGMQRGPTSTADMGPRTNLQQQRPGSPPRIAGGVG